MAISISRNSSANSPISSCVEISICPSKFSSLTRRTASRNSCSERAICSPSNRERIQPIRKTASAMKRMRMLRSITSLRICRVFCREKFDCQRTMVVIASSIFNCSGRIWLTIMSLASNQSLSRRSVRLLVLARERKVRASTCCCNSFRLRISSRIS